MRHRIPSNPLNTPRTVKELSGCNLSTYDKEFKQGKPILCSRCGKSGGTLVKDGKDGYRHADNDDRCKLLQHRRR